MFRAGKPLPSSRPTRLISQPLFILTNHARTLKTVAEAVAPISIEDFRRDAFQAQKPLLIRPSTKPPDISAANQENDANTETSTSTSPTLSLPALTKWFTTSPTSGKASLTPYLDNFRSTILPYELSSPNSAPVSDFISWLQSSSSPTASSDSNPDSNSDSDSQSRLALAHLLKTYITHHSTSSPSSSASEFLILDLPLHLLLLAHHYNTSLSSSQNLKPPLTNLYIAQAPLSHLPAPLQSDLPTPFLVSHAGRGDIYSSSIWLGLQPTYTPWHRDPNPNLFCQLCGTKRLRLMAPKRGEALFRGVMASLMAAGNPNMRGEEMMKGEQRRVLEGAVWGSGSGGGGDGDGEGQGTEMLYEVTVRAGDMLFMPLGWWHSVKSVGEEGGINGSVNWWFR
ncbi:hypothetical protein B0H65DRAFT_549930 [Neurospora tetraspora]|uniref:JmjC domain-containing protein n=1 Tax=Neurospora tetraspora TaxID=94610 RepID=A0AAE0MR65_9PEZI|nr:hypothetical protein B0H65DRAFT_549930 [Neurospora tetraspora]